VGSFVEGVCVRELAHSSSLAISKWLADLSLVPIIVVLEMIIIVVVDLPRLFNCTGVHFEKYTRYYSE
jgi:hypothetical protein